MIRLLQTEMGIFWNNLHLIKEAYDAGSDCAVQITATCDEDYETYQANGFEMLERAAEHVCSKPVYARDENGRMDTDDVMYEEWFFSSTEMTAYYRELNRLRTVGKISKERYLEMKRELVYVIERWVFYLPSCAYGGVNVDLRTKTNHRYASSLKVYMDFCDYYIDPFELACGIAVIFDTYKRKLAELKEQYGEETSDLEAA